MKIDDICRVLVDKGRGHGKGAIVKIVLLSPSEEDPEPYYCQSIEGKTSYWYSENQLEVIEREGLI